MSDWVKRFEGAWDRIDGAYAGLDHSSQKEGKYYFSIESERFKWAGPFKTIEKAIEYGDKNWPVEYPVFKP